jgi:hypothetical protein
MNRRAFVTGLGAVFAAPLGAEAQQAPGSPTTSQRANWLGHAGLRAVSVFDAAKSTPNCFAPDAVEPYAARRRAIPLTGTANLKRAGPVEDSNPCCASQRHCHPRTITQTPIRNNRGVSAVHRPGGRGVMMLNQKAKSSRRARNSPTAPERPSTLTSPAATFSSKVAAPPMI